MGAEITLAEKVVVVTGGLGLLGRSHCRGLAQAGARVVVADLDESATVEFAKELENEFQLPTMGLALDCTRKASITAGLQKILARFNRCDVLVNNAAINDKVESTENNTGTFFKFEDYPLEAWNAVMNVNLTGSFLCAQVFGEHMSSSEAGGSIINVASTYGMVAPDQSLYINDNGERMLWKTVAYPVSKAGVIALTKYLAAYWGQCGVRVNTLSPGGVQTEGTSDEFAARYSKRTPLGRMANASDYQGALVFLSSDASTYMTGSNLVVDGGWTCW